MNNNKTIIGSEEWYSFPALVIPALKPHRSMLTVSAPLNAMNTPGKLRQRSPTMMQWVIHQGESATVIKVSADQSRLVIKAVSTIALTGLLVRCVDKNL